MPSPFGVWVEASVSAFIDIVARNFICQLPTKLVPFIVNLYMLPLTGVSATWRGHGRREAHGALEDLAGDGQDLDRKRDSLSLWPWWPASANHGASCPIHPWFCQLILRCLKKNPGIEVSVFIGAVALILSTSN